MIPIVVEEFKLSKGRSDCESFQLIMFGHYTTCHISRFIRRKLKLDETKNLMFHVVQEGTAKMIGPSDTLSEHYNNWKSEDGFLYILYHFESTF